MDLIIIAGMPAAGKSTLAKKIAKTFGYPILEKDGIKEELFDHIGYADRAEKRKLDAAVPAIDEQKTPAKVDVQKIRTILLEQDAVLDHSCEQGGAVKC